MPCLQNVLSPFIARRTSFEPPTNKPIHWIVYDCWQWKEFFWLCKRFIIHFHLIHLSLAFLHRKCIYGLNVCCYPIAFNTNCKTYLTFWLDGSMRPCDARLLKMHGWAAQQLTIQMQTARFGLVAEFHLILSIVLVFIKYLYQLNMDDYLFERAFIALGLLMAGI